MRCGVEQRLVSSNSREDNDNKDRRAELGVVGWRICYSRGYVFASPRLKDHHLGTKNKSY